MELVCIRATPWKIPVALPVWGYKVHTQSRRMKNLLESWTRDWGRRAALAGQQQRLGD